MSEFTYLVIAIWAAFMFGYWCGYEQRKIKRAQERDEFFKDFDRATWQAEQTELVERIVKRGPIKRD